MTEVLRVEGLQKLFPVRKGVLQTVAGHVRAVDGVSFRSEERRVGKECCR